MPNDIPIEIKIRNGIATDMLSKMTIANGYYFNVGDVNIYENANVTEWPRMLIKIIGEENTDDSGSKPTNTHYTNKLTMECKYIYKNEENVGEIDRDLICSKLSHDLKLYFGVYYRLESYGCYQVRPSKIMFNKSSNETIPSGVTMEVECEYMQLRTQPTGM